MLKIITKEVAENLLADVPADKQFWCSDGRMFKNLAELETALRNMSEETYSYHSNENKNDFANWVQDVIGDEELAGDLRKSISRAQAARAIANRITLLKKRIRGR